MGRRVHRSQQARASGATVALYCPLLVLAYDVQSHTGYLAQGCLNHDLERHHLHQAVLRIGQRLLARGHGGQTRCHGSSTLRHTQT